MVLVARREDSRMQVGAVHHDGTFSFLYFFGFFSQGDRPTRDAVRIHHVPSSESLHLTLNLSKRKGKKRACEPLGTTPRCQIPVPLEAAKRKA